MTFIDVFAALVIMSLFMIGFSQIFLPVYSAWDAAMAEYRTADTIRFISKSFKNECIKPDRDISGWKKTIAAAKELESCEIVELKNGSLIRALKAVCVISGEYIEIIGLCTP